MQSKYGTNELGYKKSTNNLTKRKQTHRHIENKLMVIKGEKGVAEGRETESGISRDKLPYLK